MTTIEQYATRQRSQRQALETTMCMTPELQAPAIFRGSDSLARSIPFDPVAAIKLGYGTRNLGSDYIEDGLAVLARELSQQELTEIRSLVEGLDRLCLEQNCARYEEDSRFQSSINSLIEQVKLPALAACLDHSLIAQRANGTWYNLGAQWGECVRFLGRGAEDSPSADCFHRFSEACRELTETERAAIAPCDLWLEHWSRDANIADVLDDVFAGLPDRLQSYAAELAEPQRFSPAMRFLYLMIKDAELQADLLREGPVRPNNFVFGGRNINMSQRLPFLLLEYLWRCTDRTASIDDLESAIWGEDKRNDQSGDGSEQREITVIADHGISAAKKRANQFFKEQNIPFRVTQRYGSISIVDQRAIR